MKIFFLKFEISYDDQPPTRHLSTKREISFLVTNQLWQISFVQPIWNDLYDGLNLRLCVNSANYIAR